MDIGVVAGIVAIVALFIVLPRTILKFVGDNTRHRREKEVEKLKYQKEILELEIEKENLHIKSLEAENKRLDRIIDGRG
jgi:cell shape-determining protein MreC